MPLIRTEALRGYDILAATFDTMEEARAWLLTQVQPSAYVPKDRLWNTLQPYLLKNGVGARIRSRQGDDNFRATIFISPWWEKETSQRGLPQATVLRAYRAVEEAKGRAEYLNG